MDGSRDARFKEWMKAHLALLHRIARAFAEPADQHDLLQELMIAVWKAAPAFRGDSAPATFIYRVAHNRALTWLVRRSAGKRRSVDAEAEAARLAELRSGEGEDAALLDALYEAIRKLEPLERSLVLLSLERMPYRDIARLHGLTETNVGARLTRARARLAALVEDPK